LPAEGETADLSRSALEAQRAGDLVEGATVGEDVVHDEQALAGGPPRVGDAKGGTEPLGGEAPALGVAASGEARRRPGLDDGGDAPEVEWWPITRRRPEGRLGEHQPHVVEVAASRPDEGGAGDDQVEPSEQPSPLD
jgi:hypothetical protein